MFGSGLVAGLVAPSAGGFVTGLLLVAVFGAAVAYAKLDRR